MLTAVPVPGVLRGFGRALAILVVCVVTPLSLAVPGDGVAARKLDGVVRGARVGVHRLDASEAGGHHDQGVESAGTPIAAVSIGAASGDDTSTTSVRATGFWAIALGLEDPVHRTHSISFDSPILSADASHAAAPRGPPTA